jgi:PAS domain S-box-containing protein
VESSDDAIVSKTLDGIVQSWNAGAERLFGYTAAEAIGRSIAMIIPPERHNEEREILARIAAGERIDHFETVRVAKDGTRLDISLTVSPVRDHLGRIVGASKVGRDISERKRAEKALREADLRKDRFIALLAHELRNPLAPLRNGLQILRLAGNDADALSNARDMMERQLGHMVRIIDDLLDVSRVNQNRMELRRSRVLLSDVVSSAAETVRPAMESCRHDFSISLPADPVYLDADLTRLAQVFSNLLANSARYTPPGGRILLRAERTDGRLTVAVEDNGIGIPRGALPRIFDMFSQVDRVHERVSGGLGIGLALVKGLVEMHGGTVTASSAGEGQGSVFTVTLPLSEVHADLPAGAGAHAASLNFGPRRRILVADDNRDAALSLAMLLRIMGHDVTTANDGVEALEIAQAYQPHVIFMDIGMPRLNGLDATRQIREHAWGEDVRIVALTGWGQDSDRTQSRAAGCDDHLVKPVSAEDLRRVLTGFGVAGRQQ